MLIGLVSLFPEMFNSLHFGITGRALENGLLKLNIWNPRDFTNDLHHTVDDRPYGGGPGMVMKVAPLLKAINAAKSAVADNCKVIYLSPQGQSLKQSQLQKIINQKNMILVCGRYEGIDERVINLAIDEEWSIGDYVLSGGELAAMVLIDAITRLLPGVLGDEDSAQQDSFNNALLDYPHYTRPEEIAGLKVPPVLLSGDHAAIQRWRFKQALGRTWLRRPDLLQTRSLSEKEQELLNEYIRENESDARK